MLTDLSGLVVIRMLDDNPSGTSVAPDRCKLGIAPAARSTVLTNVYYSEFAIGADTT